jgi:predicted 3-demethylubiquinone-9 3-methyltransferase (glyoxalase superfamily)
MSHQFGEVVMTEERITTMLMFAGQTEEAIGFYSAP